MDEHVNGEVVTVPAQAVDRFASEVQTGLARYYQLVQELEVCQRDLRNATLDNERLRVAIDGAAERERAHVQVVIDEAKIAQHQAEVEVSMLREEVASVRRELAAANRTAEDARVEAAGAFAALRMIGSNVVEVLNRRPPQRQQEASHAGR